MNTGETIRKDILKQAEDFLYKVKTSKDVGRLGTSLSRISWTELLRLNTDDMRKAFWINMYNAWFQILVARGTDRKIIFTASPFQFADVDLSLDEMEHGILRKLKPHPSSGTPEKYPEPVQQLAVEKEDPRIHFALNCGQKSCPPIAFYHAEKVEQQLDWATVAYLEQETSFTPKENLLEVNELLRWYQADFGGEAGILQMLKQYQLIPENSKPLLRFTPYDHSLTPMDFA